MPFTTTSSSVTPLNVPPYHLLVPHHILPLCPILQLIGPPIIGFLSGKPDPFGFEGGEMGPLGFKGDASLLPEMYPPPPATKVVPMRIDFFENADNVNVGHFNQVSMTMGESSTSTLPLLQKFNQGMSIAMEGMNMVTYNTSEVSTQHLPSPPLTMWKH
jgi:hypothetical protein